MECEKHPGTGTVVLSGGMEVCYGCYCLCPDDVDCRKNKAMDIRDKIAQHLFYRKYPPSNDPLAYNLRWEDIPFDGCESSAPFYKEADQLLAVIKEAGYVKLADIEPKMQLEQCDPDTMAYFTDYYWMSKEDWQAIKKQAGGK